MSHKILKNFQKIFQFAKCYIFCQTIFFVIIYSTSAMSVPSFFRTAVVHETNQSFFIYIVM